MGKWEQWECGGKWHCGNIRKGAGGNIEKRAGWEYRKKGMKWAGWEYRGNWHGGNVGKGAKWEFMERDRVGK